MNKMKLLKILNPLLGISFMLQVISIVALIMGKVPGWLFKLHLLNGKIFVLLAITHVVLNWAWIKANFLKNHENTVK